MNKIKGIVILLISIVQLALIAQIAMLYFEGNSYFMFLVPIVGVLSLVYPFVIGTKNNLRED